MSRVVCFSVAAEAFLRDQAREKQLAASNDLQLHGGAGLDGISKVTKLGPIEWNAPLSQMERDVAKSISQPKQTQEEAYVHLDFLALDEGDELTPCAACALNFTTGSRGGRSAGAAAGQSRQQFVFSPVYVVHRLCCNVTIVIEIVGVGR